MDISNGGELKMKIHFSLQFVSTSQYCNLKYVHKLWDINHSPVKLRLKQNNLTDQSI